MVRNLADLPSRPLSEDPAFLAAREALPREGVSFLYINAEGIADILIDPEGPRYSIVLLDDMPEYIEAGNQPNADARGALALTSQEKREIVRALALYQV